MTSSTGPSIRGDRGLGAARPAARPRRDPVRACLLIRGGWLVTLWVAFSALTTVNAYYTAALAPAVGAILGTGVTLAWNAWRDAAATSAAAPDAVGRGRRVGLAAGVAAIAAVFAGPGYEVLPIGGFTGSIPSPTLAQIQTDIRDGSFHLVIGLAGTTDPRFAWIAAHCRDLSAGGAAVTYYCIPADAEG